MKPVLCWLSIETSGDNAKQDQLLSVHIRTEHATQAPDLFSNYLRLKDQQLPNLNHLIRYQLNPFLEPFSHGLSEVQLVNELVAFAKRYTQQEIKPLIICQRQKDVLFLINTFQRCGLNFNRYFNKAVWDSSLNLKLAFPQLQFKSFSQAAVDLNLSACANEYLAFVRLTKLVYEKLTQRSWEELAQVVTVQPFARYQLISNSLNSGIKTRAIIVLEDLPAYQKLIVWDEETQKVLSFNYGTLLSVTPLSATEFKLTESIQLAWSIEKEKNQSPLTQDRWSQIVEMERMVSYQTPFSQGITEVEQTYKSKLSPPELKALLVAAEEYSRSLGKPAWTQPITEILPLSIKGYQVRLLPEGLYEINQQTFETKLAVVNQFPELIGKLPERESFINPNHPRLIRKALQSDSGFINRLRPHFEAWLGNPSTQLQNLSSLQQELKPWRLTTPPLTEHSYLHGHFFNTLTKQPEISRYKLHAPIQEILKVYASKLLVEFTDQSIGFIEFLPPHLFIMNTAAHPLTWEYRDQKISLLTVDRLDVNEQYILTQKIKANVEIDTATFLAKLKTKPSTAIKAESSSEIFANLSETLNFLTQKLKPSAPAPSEFVSYVSEAALIPVDLQTLIAAVEQKDLNTLEFPESGTLDQAQSGRFGIVQAVNGSVELYLAEFMSSAGPEIYFIDRVLAQSLRMQGYNRHQIIFMATKKLSRDRVINIYLF